MMKEDVDVHMSTKLGRPVTKEFINETCKNCGMNNACQNQALAERLEKELSGDNNATQPEGPTKTR
jgi:positive regulator of sigma E activity